MRPAHDFEDMQDLNTDLPFRIGTFDDDRLVAKKLGSFRCWLVASPELNKKAAPMARLLSLEHFSTI